MNTKTSFSEETKNVEKWTYPIVLMKFYTHLRVKWEFILNTGCSFKVFSKTRKSRNTPTINITYFPKPCNYPTLITIFLKV